MHPTKFSSQIDLEVLAAVKTIAAQEGRQLQSVLDEALRDFEKKRSDKPRRHVMEALASSVQEFDTLYTNLAT